jgi:hypothetical protein
MFLEFQHEGGEKQTIMHTEGDEDTPAVTFYFTDDAYGKPLLKKTFEEALRLLDNPARFEDAVAALDSTTQE